MPRLLIVAVLLLAVAACRKADPAPAAADTAPAESKLEVGSPAPPLKVAEWVKGDAVPAFEPGKVYVVEFWATWCGPCLSAMPHLGDLAAQYKPQGLTVIAVTTADNKGNSPQAIAAFAAGRGKDLPVTIARCDTFETQEAYLDAAGLSGIPATFVIDREGKVAFIGRPDDLDEVLPKVLGGTWQGAADAHALKRQAAELDDILGKLQVAAELAELSVGRSADRAAAAAAVNKAITKAAGEVAADLEAFAAKHPGRAAKATFRMNQSQVLLAADRPDDARAVTADLLAAATARRNPDVFRMVIDQWTNRGLNPRRRHAELAVKAADEWLKLDGENVGTLMAAAQAYLFAGETKKGRAFGEKALDLTTDPRQRVGMEQALRQLEG